MWNIGVYIDADNISSEMAEQGIKLLESEGRISFIRAYGNWTSKSGSWKRLVNHYGVETTHRYNISRAKNASDISLTVDAVASLYSAMRFDTMAVISSDSDFLPLLKHAQACGKRTVGVGCRKAPPTYTQQCHRFLFLDSEPCAPMKVAASR